LPAIRDLVKLLSLEVCGYSFEDLVELAFHDQVELVQRQADSMIGEAVLGEVVRPNFFASIARADS